MEAGSVVVLLLVGAVGVLLLLLKLRRRWPLWAVEETLDMLFIYSY
jgi:hypothetical protein